MTVAITTLAIATVATGTVAVVTVAIATVAVVTVAIVIGCWLDSRGDSVRFPVGQTVCLLTLSTPVLGLAQPSI